MRIRLNVVVTAAIMMSVGLITILGLLIGAENPFYPVISSLRIDDFARLFVRLSVIVMAASLLVGIVNLLTVHINRLIRGRGRVLNRLNSLVLIISFLGALAIYFLGISRDVSTLLLEDVQVSIESSLAGLMFFALVYGAFRVMRHKITLDRLLFILSLLLVLIGSLPLPFPQIIREISAWVLDIPVNAGAQGILLGIALATILTGVRVLLGQDRTYSA